MDKSSYIKPVIKVVSFRVEQGYNSSPLVGLSLVPRGGNVSTGENFTEITDNGGEYYPGRWN